MRVCTGITNKQDNANDDIKILMQSKYVSHI